MRSNFRSLSPMGVDNQYSKNVAELTLPNGGKHVHMLSGNDIGKVPLLNYKQRRSSKQQRRNTKTALVLKSEADGSDITPSSVMQGKRGIRSPTSGLGKCPTLFGEQFD